MWQFRPSAFSSSKKIYSIMGGYELFEQYEKDNKRAEQEGVAVPPPRKSHGTRRLRTCQWNVHYFDPVAEESNSRKLAMKIADQVIETDADVIVINEFGTSPFKEDIEDETGAFVKDVFGREKSFSVNCFRDRLSVHGYTIYTAQSSFPTAVAIRLPLHSGVAVQKISLDSNRAAVALPLNLGEDKGDDTSELLWIYATHLEAWDDAEGRNRREEMETLLEKIGENNDSQPVRTLVIGDFNQQREQDYTKEEWDDIVASKKRRRSPVDDGVASLLCGDGFHCIFDDSVLNQKSKGNLPKVARNWSPKSPPPSTHWSGTVIDYTYFRGPGLRMEGVYVSPSNLSDHRMVVCDWLIDSS